MQPLLLSRTQFVTVPANLLGMARCWCASRYQLIFRVVVGKLNFCLGGSFIGYESRSKGICMCTKRHIPLFDATRCPTVARCRRTMPPRDAPAY